LNRYRVRDRTDYLMIAVLLEIEKEEGLVVPIVNLLSQCDGPTDCKAVVMSADRRFRVQPWRRGIQNVVVKIFVRASVKLIGAGFTPVVEESVADLLVFWREVAGQDRPFLKGVDVWLLLGLGRRNLAVAGVLTFEPIGSRVSRRAVYFDRRIRHDVCAGKKH